MSLVSISRPVDDITPLRFLQLASHFAPHQQRIYWEHADSDYVFAGYGIAVELFASGDTRFQTIHTQVARLFSDAHIETIDGHITPRMFGGFAFRADTPLSGLWQSFASAYFVLPRCVLTRYSGITWLTINARIPDGETGDLPGLRAELEDVARQIEDAALIPDSGTTPLSEPHINYPLDREGWCKQITDAIRRMKAGELDKVVLSRTCDVMFEHPVDPLSALANIEHRYASSYRFLIEPAVGSAFFGATPELLAEVNGRALKTAALAASIKRGATPAEDDQLAATLWSNPKERYEHGLVVEGLRDLLEPHANELIIPEVPGFLKLSNIQHLYTPIYGELNDDYGVLPIVEKLHPTPALGGYPRSIAMDTIAASELIPRGWYASPVGWLDMHGNGTFAVAIRSAVSGGNHARLYAGAGIVADSDPDREWDETRLKFRPMLEALGVRTT